MRKRIWKRLGWSITASEDKKKCLVWLFFFFVLQLILQYYYPMTSDDLYFRYGVEISNKNDLFNYVLHFGNGRYLGNSSVLILVRCHWLRALSKAVIMTAIYGELIYLLDLKNELQTAFDVAAQCENVCTGICMDRWISELYCSDILIFNGYPLLEKM